MIMKAGKSRVNAALFAVLILLAPSVLAAKDQRPPTYSIPMPPKPNFSSLAWMIGKWTGQTVKHSPSGEIQLSVSYDLDRRVMVFREQVHLDATNEAPASNESSIGILSAAPSSNSFQFQVYSSKGFISRYRVTVAGSEIDFTPNGGPQPLPGWLSRRIIQRSDIDGFTETVQLAPPQKSFFNYYTAAFTRQSATKNFKTGVSGNHKKP